MQNSQRKFLFVCLGNICRSPMAQAVFDKVAENAGLAGRVRSDSAGISGYHRGEDPDYRTLEILHQKGLVIHHKARQIDARDFSEFDFIIPMDSSNMIDIITQFPEAAALKGERLFLIRDFDIITGNRDVPDPYWGGKDGFEDVYRILFRSITRLMSHLIEKGPL